MATITLELDEETYRRWIFAKNDFLTIKTVPPRKLTVNDFIKELLLHVE